MSAERAEERERFVVNASEAVLASPDYETALANLARTAVPGFADWSAVLVCGNERIAAQPSSLAHHGHGELEAVWQVCPRHPTGPNSEVGLSGAVRTGRSQLHRTVDDALIGELACSDPVHVEGLRRRGLVSAIVVPLPAPGGIRGSLAFASAESGRTYDDDDLRVVEDLGRTAGLTIENAILRGSLDRAADARNRLLAVLSHDLRNPLGSIKLRASAISSEDQSVRRHVAAVLRNVDQMAKLLGDLVDFAKLEAGALQPVVSPCDVGSLVRDAIDTIEPIARQKSVLLSCEHVDEAPPVECDRERIKQVLLSLLDNAVKFSQKGGRVRVTTSSWENRVVVSVSDSGPGIEEEELEKIFEPYYRGARETCRGIGLGLSIARSLVEAHGGRIEVESRLGTGTCFSFSLESARVGRS